MTCDAPLIHTSQLCRDCPNFTNCHRLNREYHLLAGVLKNRTLSSGAKVLLGQLILIMREKGGRRVSNKELFRITGMPERTARRHRDELRKAQLLSWEVEGNGGTDLIHRYKVH